MSHCMRILVLLALSISLLVPVTAAQKPPAPAPPPSPPRSDPSSNPTTPFPRGADPGQPKENFVMFLSGRVATNDNTPVPNDLLVERVCNANVRQQVYASARGDFSMQLGSRTDTFVDASGNPSSRYGRTNKESEMGIPLRELKNCELRASASGFHPKVISLVSLDTSLGNVDVGVIVVQRSKKIRGTTLSATTYKAPKDARNAYEKGLDAEWDGKLANARKYFEAAVGIYPAFTSAWFQLGNVLRKENENDAARKAYAQATTIDSKFVPPYFSLASMACESGNWDEVISLTRHILELDPSRYANATGYILDLDPLDYAEVYFYNALANYKLNKIEEAEKSGLMAEHLDVRPRFPQLHLLLAEIFVRKNKYALAISEIRTYLELAPQGKNADQAREQLAMLEKLNAPMPAGEKPDQR
jgi:Tetratricopeptide repeat